MASRDRLTFKDVVAYSLKRARENLLEFDYFKCENPAFNDYFNNNLTKDDHDKLGKAFLFATHDRKVIGFIVLSMSQLSKSYHTELGNLTPTNIPALLIRVMARHTEYRGSGVGTLLKDFAINKALELSELVGCRLLVLESTEDQIQRYKNWGFMPIEAEYRNLMFIDLLKLTDN